jgi:hypothetical protein
MDFSFMLLEKDLSAQSLSCTDRLERRATMLCATHLRDLAVPKTAITIQPMLTYKDHRVTYLARVDYRRDRRVFGIKRADRRSHVYIIGKTGTGKSTLLANMIRQDILAGEGLAGCIRSH